MLYGCVGVDRRRGDGCACEHVKMLVEAARAQKPGEDLPPLISQIAVDKIGNYLDQVAAKVVNIAVDGRKVPKPAKGYYIGSSVIDYRDWSAPMPEIFRSEILVRH